MSAPGGRRLALSRWRLPASSGRRAAHEQRPDRQVRVWHRLSPNLCQLAKRSQLLRCGHDLAEVTRGKRSQCSEEHRAITPEGKERSRCNARRHGPTAEAVTGSLEDAEDYEAFEAAVIADYDGEMAVQREPVLRLASILWRLRRSSAIESALFEAMVGERPSPVSSNPSSRKVIAISSCRTNRAGENAVDEFVCARLRTWPRHSSA